MTRILIVVTNHGTYPSTGEKTGLWLGEVTHFYDLMDRAGHEMDVVSPRGGEVPLDPRSLSRLFLDRQTNTSLEHPAFMGWLNRTRSPDQVDGRDYQAIYYAGGHGTMWDFPDNALLQQISQGIYERGGIVSSVCHGAAGLLNIRLSDGAPLIQQRTVTGFSNREERLIRLSAHVPFSLEDQLKSRGAHYRQAVLPFTPYAQTDGRLVTGQNPQSARQVATRVLALLNQPAPSVKDL